MVIAKPDSKLFVKINCFKGEDQDVKCKKGLDDNQISTKINENNKAINLDFNFSNIGIDLHKSLSKDHNLNSNLYSNFLKCASNKMETLESNMSNLNIDICNNSKQQVNSFNCSNSKFSIGNVNY